MKLERRRVLKIMGLGLSGFTMSITNSLVQIVCNATLRDFGGDLYVGAMTVINSIREVVQMPVQGLTNSAQPVMGFNYGRRNTAVSGGHPFTSAVSIVYTCAIWAGSTLPRDFSSASSAARRSFWPSAFPPCTYTIWIFHDVPSDGGQAVFVALGRAKNAVFFSIFRKVIIVFPLTVILPISGGWGRTACSWRSPSPTSSAVGLLRHHAPHRVERAGGKRKWQGSG